MPLTTNMYLADAILNLLKGVAIATPISIRIALTTTIPVRSDTNTTLVRTTYPGYTDIIITSGQWSNIVENLNNGSIMTTISNINFPNVSSTPSPVSIIVGFAILDNNDNIYYQGSLSTPLIINTNGQIVEIPSGALTITEN